MPSTRRAELLNDLESDVPISPQEAEAQWKIRNGRRLSTPDYLAWCRAITRDSTTPATDLHTEPFEL